MNELEDTKRSGEQPDQEGPAEGDGPPTPEDFENDPARNPEDETLKDVKGG